jgi:hypothetical protein
MIFRNGWFISLGIIVVLILGKLLEIDIRIWSGGMVSLTIPKHAFISWLAMHNALLTGDKMLSWDY